MHNPFKKHRGRMKAIRGWRRWFSGQESLSGPGVSAADSSRAKVRYSYLKLFYTEVSMSYQSAIDHLAAMAPELATQTGHTRRKFSIDEVAIFSPPWAIPTTLSPPFSSPERTVRVRQLPHSRRFSRPQACALASTLHHTWRAPTSASASTALKSPTRTSPSTFSASEPPDKSWSKKRNWRRCQVSLRPSPLWRSCTSPNQPLKSRFSKWA